MGIFSWVKRLSKVEFLDVGCKSELILNGDVIMTNLNYETLSPTRVIGKYNHTKTSDGKTTDANIHSVYESLRAQGIDVSIVSTAISERRFI